MISFKLQPQSAKSRLKTPEKRNSLKSAIFILTFSFLISIFYFFTLLYFSGLSSVFFVAARGLNRDGLNVIIYPG